MTFPRLSFAPRRIFRSDFAPEWIGVGAIFLLALVWMAVTDFELRVVWHDGLLAFVSIGVVLASHSLAAPRFSLIAEYFTLTLFATCAFGVLSYLSMSTGAPLVDRELLAADRALGFQWLPIFQWLEAHLTVAKVLQVIYDSLVYQGLYFCVLFGLMNKKQDLRELFWIVFVAGLFTSAGAALFPALGTFKMFGFDSHGSYLPDMEKLRSGQHLSFVFAKLGGVVSFPSFHTTMALVYIYGFRRMGVIACAIGALNLVMLFAIPFFGGHYLVDMIAGAIVMLVSLGIVKAWPMLRNANGAYPAPMPKDALAG